MTEFSAEECQAIFDVIKDLSGGNPENCFVWDGSEDPQDKELAAMAKLFIAVGRKVPKEMVPHDKS